MAVAAGAAPAIDEQSLVDETPPVSGAMALELVLPPSVSESLAPS